MWFCNSYKYNTTAIICNLQLFVKVIGKQAKALPNIRPFHEEAANDPEAQASGHLMVTKGINLN